VNVIGETSVSPTAHSVELRIMIRPAIVHSLAALSALTFSPSGRAFAAEVKVHSARAVAYTSYSTLHSADTPAGAVAHYRPPQGNVLWMVTISYSAAWDEKSERIEVLDELFGLYDGERKLPAVGDVAGLGVIDPYLSSPSFYRPDDWKERKPEPQWGEFLFVAPAGKKELALKMDWVVPSPDGEQDPTKATKLSVPLKLAADPKAFNINDHVEVRVRAVKMLASMPENDPNQTNPAPAAPELENIGGSILQLTLEVTPKSASVPYQEVFNGRCTWLGLSFGRGGRAVCMGKRSYGELEPQSGFTIEKADGDIWNRETFAAFFPVPSNLRTFDVTFLGQVVAKGEITATAP
jgi:hypothetical protein